jgi:hypothetical protein
VSAAARRSLCAYAPPGAKIPTISLTGADPRQRAPGAVAAQSRFT